MVSAPVIPHIVKGRHRAKPHKSTPQPKPRGPASMLKGRNEVRALPCV